MPPGLSATSMLAFVSPWIADALYVSVAMMWLIPDRRIERVFAGPHEVAEKFPHGHAGVAGCHGRIQVDDVGIGLEALGKGAGDFVVSRLDEMVLSGPCAH